MFIKKVMYSKLEIAINLGTATFLEAKDHSLYLYVNVPQGQSLHKTFASDVWPHVVLKIISMGKDTTAEHRGRASPGGSVDTGSVTVT